MALSVLGLKPAETVRNVYQINIPAGTTPEELLEPTFWSHVAAKLRAGDRIEVVTGDAAWFAELRVMEVGRAGSFGARVAFTTSPVALSNEHVLPVLNDFEARPSGAGWQVFKVGSTEPVKTDLPDQISAQKWITSQRRALAA